MTLAEARENENYVLWNAVLLPKFYENLPTQYFTEIGQSAAVLSPKQIFNIAAVRRLEFLDIQHLCHVMSIAILHCVPKKCDHVFDDKLN